VRKQKTLCGINPRAWAELVSREPFQLRFTYPCGYTKVVDVAADKSLRKVAAPLLVRWTSPHGYWTKEGGGVHEECPRCRRAALSARNKEGRS
jgi:hypothetical protein